MRFRQILALSYLLAIGVFSGVLPATANGEVPAPNNSTSTPSLPNVPTEIVNTQVNQQPGVVQLSNLNGFSNLATPTCPVGCIYFQGRMSPSASGVSNWEASGGVVFPFGSSDSNAESNRLNVEIQKYRTENETIAGLSRELSDAIENNKMVRARLIAINLAPKLGYKNYEQLLFEMSKQTVRFTGR
jgi:hypothetical protein